MLNVHPVQVRLKQGRRQQSMDDQALLDVGGEIIVARSAWQNFGPSSQGALSLHFSFKLGVTIEVLQVGLEL